MIAKFIYDKSSSNIDVLNNSVRLITEFISEENIRGESSNNRANISICLTGIYSSIVIALTKSILTSISTTPIFSKFLYVNTVILLIISVFNSIRVVLVKQVDKLSPYIVNDIQSFEHIEALRYEIKWKMWQYNKLNEINLTKLFYLHRAQRTLLLSSFNLLMICPTLYFTDNLVSFETMNYIKTIEMVLGVILISFSFFSNPILEKKSYWNNNKHGLIGNTEIKKMNKIIGFKKFKRKYKSINLFINLIIIGMVISLGFSYYLQYIFSEPFFSSLFLNVFGGLSTGLIILLYQHYSNKKLNEAQAIVEQITEIDEIPIVSVSILDFCTDDTYPLNEDEIESFDIDKILSDEECTISALEKYKNYLHEIKNQFSKIKNFNDNVLMLDINCEDFSEKLDDVIKYFSKYQIQKVQKSNSYLLRDKKTGDVIDVIDDIDVIDVMKYDEELYYIDEPSPAFRNIQIVLENDEEFNVKIYYGEWIKKMENILKSTNDFNSIFMKEKSKIILFNNNFNTMH
nr:hypothetical protein [Sedimentibacter sp.]